jgi:hypothetical protein
MIDQRKNKMQSGTVARALGQAKMPGRAKGRGKAPAPSRPLEDQKRNTEHR